VSATPSELVASPRRKARVVVRILALLVVVIVAIFCGGALSAVTNNVSHPTCAAVAARSAQLPGDGACYGGSSFQQYSTLVLVLLSAGAVAAALVLSLVLLVTGRRGRLFLAALGTGVALLLIGALITHASSSRVPSAAVGPGRILCAPSWSRQGTAQGCVIGSARSSVASWPPQGSLRAQQLVLT
jgi:hypothetical protein